MAKSAIGVANSIEADASYGKQVFGGVLGSVIGLGWDAAGIGLVAGWLK